MTGRPRRRYLCLGLRVRAGASVVWAKLASLTAGAELASRRL